MTFPRLLTAAISRVLIPTPCRQRDALWANFQASVSTPPSSNDHGETSSQPPVVKRVKVLKTFLFGGRHVTYVSRIFSFRHRITYRSTHDHFVHPQPVDRTVCIPVYPPAARVCTFCSHVVDVPEDSEEATKWPRWITHPHPTSESAPALTPTSERGQGENKDNGDSPAPPPAVDPSPAAPTIMTSTPGLKRPGPRKPRNALPSIPKASQAKKITTLEKSVMDWRVHVASQSSDVKDELDTNRRGGGYLEKVDFLKRVEDRREDVFEASKSNKRRKT